MVELIPRVAYIVNPNEMYTVPLGFAYRGIFKTLEIIEARCLWGNL